MNSKFLVVAWPDKTYKVYDITAGNSPDQRQLIMTAYENDLRNCPCCKQLRPMKLKFFAEDKVDKPDDKKKKDVDPSPPVMEIQRPYRCSLGGSCCCLSCLQYMGVYSPPEISIGSVRQECNLSQTSFAIRDPSNTLLRRITGPYCICCNGSNIVFDINNKNNVSIGKIATQYSGISDSFTVYSYTAKDKPNVQKLELAGGFLCYFMYFEPDTYWYALNYVS